MILEPKDRDIAMVFQSYGLYPNMTVYENIRFPLKVRKVDLSTHAERVQRAVDMVELNDFTHRRPAELSGGQRQRVALARAIVREPTVFFDGRTPCRTLTRNSGFRHARKSKTCKTRWRPPPFM